MLEFCRDSYNRGVNRLKEGVQTQEGRYVLRRLPKNFINAIQVENSPEFQQALPHVEEVFGKTHFWHGIGRYQYDDEGNIIDVLGLLIEKGGLQPRYDDLHISKGPMNSISASLSRMYAALYAKRHFYAKFPEKPMLSNQLGKPIRWVAYFLGRFEVDLMLLAISKIRRRDVSFGRGVSLLKREILKSGEETSIRQWKRRSNSQANRFNVVRSFLYGSDIKDNYPMLFGIGKVDQGSIIPYGRDEVRFISPIQWEDITYIEVPLQNIEETRQVFEEAGIDVPIVPMEYAENYCRRFSFSQLVKGEPLKKEDAQETGWITAEVLEKLPQAKQTVSILKKYVPKASWFTKERMAFDEIHGIGHHARVIIWTEAIAQKLIENGKTAEDDFNKDILRLTASVHDIRRRHNGFDKGHGFRVAAWVEENFQEIGDDLSQDDIPVIQFVLACHDVNINNNTLLQEMAEKFGLDETRKDEAMFYLKVLKDADALERLRLAYWFQRRHIPLTNKLKKKIGLDVKYLNFDVSREMVPVARELIYLSLDDKDRYKSGQADSVFTSAVLLNVLKDKR